MINCGSTEGTSADVFSQAIKTEPCHQQGPSSHQDITSTGVESLQGLDQLGSVTSPGVAEVDVKIEILDIKDVHMNPLSPRDEIKFDEEQIKDEIPHNCLGAGQTYLDRPTPVGIYKSTTGSKSATFPTPVYEDSGTVIGSQAATQATEQLQKYDNVLESEPSTSAEDRSVMFVLKPESQTPKHQEATRTLSNPQILKKPQPMTGLGELLQRSKIVFGSKPMPGSKEGVEESRVLYGPGGPLLLSGRTPEPLQARTVIGSQPISGSTQEIHQSRTVSGLQPVSVSTQGLQQSGIVGGLQPVSVSTQGLQQSGIVGGLQPVSGSTQGLQQNEIVGGLQPVSGSTQGLQQNEIVGGPPPVTGSTQGLQQSGTVSGLQPVPGSTRGRRQSRTAIGSRTVPTPSGATLDLRGPRIISVVITKTKPVNGQQSDSSSVTELLKSARVTGQQPIPEFTQVCPQSGAVAGQRPIPLTKSTSEILQPRPVARPQPATSSTHELQQTRILFGPQPVPLNRAGQVIRDTRIISMVTQPKAAVTQPKAAVTQPKLKAAFTQPKTVVSQPAAVVTTPKPVSGIQSITGSTHALQKFTAVILRQTVPGSTSELEQSRIFFIPQPDTETDNNVAVAIAEKQALMRVKIKQGILPGVVCDHNEPYQRQVGKPLPPSIVRQIKTFDQLPPSKELTLQGERIYTMYNRVKRKKMPRVSKKKKCVIPEKEPVKPEKIKTHNYELLVKPKEKTKKKMKMKKKREKSYRSRAKPFLCNDCGVEFDTVIEFDTHMAVHGYEKGHHCDLCNMDFFMEYSLQVHVDEIHRNPFHCRICKERFETSDLLSTHLMDHSNRKPFQCDLCGKLFANRYGLKIHVAYQHDQTEKPHTCTVCGRKFRLLCYLKSHATCHAEKNYKCGICNKAFFRSYVRDRHQRIHSGLKPYQCPSCYKRFSNIPALNCHAFVHRRRNPYRCPVCYKVVRKARDLIRHLRQAPCATYSENGNNPEPVSDSNKPPKPKNMLCPICGDTFDGLRSLKFHINRHSEQASHTCVICNKEFFSKTMLRRHKIMHRIDTSYDTIMQEEAEEERKPFQCEHCKKRYPAKYQLRSHMKVHTGEKLQCSVCGENFGHWIGLRSHRLKRHGIGKRGLSASSGNRKCNICKREFSAPVYLKRHMVIHTGEKPYSCSQCDQSFLWITALQRHIADAHEILEERRRPFQCYHCKRRYKSKYDLQSHLRLHSGEKPYQCQVCGQKFTHYAGMRYHKLTKHPVEKKRSSLILDMLRSPPAFSPAQTVTETTNAD